MDWPETFAEAFPHPRNDEPASLRQDIADELADHLQSALRRQLLTTPDEILARTQVVDRFGNPQHIARQLWLEAIQEKFMSQRISLAVTAVLALVCVIALGIMWRVVERGQDATLVLIEESRAANQALLERLAQLPTGAAGISDTAAPTKSLDWNPFTAHLVKGEKGGPPAEGVFVRLSRRQAHQGALEFEVVAEEHTGPDGNADLGLVSPGKYVLCAGNGYEFFSQPVSVAPGSTNAVEIVCPSAKIEKVDVRVHTDMPDDLRRKDLYLTVELVLGPRDFSGFPWRNGFNGTRAFDGQIVLIIAPDGRVGWTPQRFGEMEGVWVNKEPRQRFKIISLLNMGQDLRMQEQRPIEAVTTEHYVKAISVSSPFGAIPTSAAPAAALGVDSKLEAPEKATLQGLVVRSEWDFLPEQTRSDAGIFEYRISDLVRVTLPILKLETACDNVWHITVPNEFWDKARADLERVEEISRPEPTARATAY